MNEIKNDLKPKNRLYHSIGFLFLVLNKIRHTIEGYKTPRTFSVSNIDTSINYDIDVVNNWLDMLNTYSESKVDINGKSVLELGPGEDIGIGLYLLFRGIKEYNAIDANQLIKSISNELYDYLFNYLQKEMNADATTIAFLKTQLDLFSRNKSDKLNYVYNKKFDFTALKNKKIDLFFSQAAFEHFDDIEKTISSISGLAKSGSMLIASVDLKTHTRWIRDVDPLNIYRYSDLIYKLLKFKGSPNRLRPYQYKDVLVKNNWYNVQIIPRKKLSEDYLSKVKPSLYKKFRDQKNQMECLAVYICATKK